MDFSSILRIQIGFCKNQKHIYNVNYLWSLLDQMDMIALAIPVRGMQLMLRLPKWVPLPIRQLATWLHLVL